MPGGQDREHLRELGDVRLAAGVGMRKQRDAAVPGDHQAQADQPQVRAFLLGLAALRDRHPGVAGVDEGGEIRHVQRHRAACPARAGRTPPVPASPRSAAARPAAPRGTRPRTGGDPAPRPGSW